MVVLPASTPRIFLSTPSARRATPRSGRMPPLRCNFYPRPPRGGRPYRQHGRRSSWRISIHALREEGDLLLPCKCRYKSFYFYPRPPRGGRPKKPGSSSAKRNFYPRPPRGGRLQDYTEAPQTLAISIHALREEGDQHGGGERYAVQRFLSTPSARRATAGRSLSKRCSNYFYPRPPRGGRPKVCIVVSQSIPISIHALREEGDAGT